MHRSQGLAEHGGELLDEVRAVGRLLQLDDHSLDNVVVDCRKIDLCRFVVELDASSERLRRRRRCLLEGLFGHSAGVSSLEALAGVLGVRVGAVGRHRGSRLGGSSASGSSGRNVNAQARERQGLATRVVRHGGDGLLCLLEQEDGRRWRREVEKRRKLLRRCLFSFNIPVNEENSTHANDLQRGSVTGEAGSKQRKLGRVKHKNEEY